MADREPRRGRHAFSLIETIVSVGIIATALLMVVGIFSAFTLQGAKYSTVENGVLVAQTQLDQNIYALLWAQAPYTSALKAAYFADAGPNALASGTVTSNNQHYSYTITNQLVLDPGGTTPNHLQRFDVKVTWNQASGSGDAVTSLTRLVNENATQ